MVDTFIFILKFILNLIGYIFMKLFNILYVLNKCNQTVFKKIFVSIQPLVDEVPLDISSLGTKYVIVETIFFKIQLIGLEDLLTFKFILFFLNIFFFILLYIHFYILKVIFLNIDFSFFNYKFIKFILKSIKFIFYYWFIKYNLISNMLNKLLLKSYLSIIYSIIIMDFMIIFIIFIISVILIFLWLKDRL